jgi:hypothetical protein
MRMPSRFRPFFTMKAVGSRPSKVIPFDWAISCQDCLFERTSDPVIRAPHCPGAKTARLAPMVLRRAHTLPDPRTRLSLRRLLGIRNTFLRR